MFELGERADQGEANLPEGLIIQDEIALRAERLENLTKAKGVLEERAKERYEANRPSMKPKCASEKKKARKTRRKPRGRKPKPPTPGPRDKDQYNFTDPDSRIMKNSTNEGFDQHYNVQVAVDQDSLLDRRPQPFQPSQRQTGSRTDPGCPFPKVGPTRGGCLGQRLL